MDYIAIARKKFDLGAKQIEDKINAIYGDGGVYAWSRKEDKGVDSILANDCVNDIPLFVCEGTKSLLPKLVSSTITPMEQRSDPGDIDTAVQEVIEALSPRSSLRISKEIIKNQLSSWIMSIEEEIEEKKVNKEPQGSLQSSSSSSSEMIAGNLSTHDDAKDIYVQSVSSGGDSRASVEKEIEDDEESELGFFKLVAENNEDDAIVYQGDHIGNDEEDEVNLGADHEDVSVPNDAKGEEDDDGDEEAEEDEEDRSAEPGPSFLAAAAAANMRMEEIGGSVSITLNAVDNTAVAAGRSEPSYSLSVDSSLVSESDRTYAEQNHIDEKHMTMTADSTDFSVYVSDSDDSSTKRAPVKSLTPEDVLRLEQEEQWLEAAIAERIAFLRQ